MIHEDVRLDKLLERAFEASNYREKTARFARENEGGGKLRRGIGFASFMHGAGFTGSGERTLGSTLGIEAGAGGRVTILSASTEIGQGTNTILSQIAADALGIDYDDVNMAKPDTAGVPNSGPTVASRTCMVVGKLVESAALGLKQTLMNAGFLNATYSRDDFRAACFKYREQFGALRSFSQYQAPPGVFWDDDTYRGDAYGAYAWAVYVAEVTVDTATYETRIDNFTAVQEIGRVIHPVLAAGQIEGGVAQAIGFALYEQVVWKEGRMVNNQMTNYIIPTAADIPPIHVIFEETPYAYGPGGAKGIGELPMDGPAPAIANAIENALGVPVDCIPAMPEDLMKLVEKEPAFAGSGAD